MGFYTVNKDNQEPLVSIFCATYNHVLYIRDAIDGFLMQKTDFPFEIVIHDDASTDGTVEILQEYEKKFWPLIKVVYEEENQYSKGNFNEYMILLERQLKGKYVAICEGDDFWIDSRKLQIQVDYLEENPECMISVHNALQINCINHHMELVNRRSEEGDLQAEEVIVRKKGFVPTASMVYRKDLLNMPLFFLKTGVGDYTSLLYGFSTGKIHYFDRVMSVYRLLHQGSWQEEQLQKLDKHFWHCVKLIDFLDLYNEYTKEKYKKYIISMKQIFLDSIVERYSIQQLKNYLKECEKNPTEESLNYVQYLQAIESFCEQKYNLSFCNENVKAFAERYKYIVIMGNGVYGNILKKQLDSNNIFFDGVIVSDNQKISNEEKEKKIWHIKDMPFDKENTGILVGINPVIWWEIEENLENAGLENYMCPFIL